jgi:hypothetical protein
MVAVPRAQGRTGTCQIVTTSEHAPKPEIRSVGYNSVTISWLMERLVNPTSAAKGKAGGSVLDMVVTFEIDRKKASVIDRHVSRV